MTCLEAPGLAADKQRLLALGGTFLGIIGDANHSFGFHLCSPPSGDYSLAGAVNRPVGTYACAIDAGMNWPASRRWLAWLIAEIREDRIQGVAEVIGSLDGRNVRYWSDSSGWHQEGVPYTGEGHDTWTHISIYRSTALDDHRLLAGWTATGLTQEDDMPLTTDELYGIIAGVANGSTAAGYIELTAPPAYRAIGKYNLRALDAKLDAVLRAQGLTQADIDELQARPAAGFTAEQVRELAAALAAEVDPAAIEATLVDVLGRVGFTVRPA